MTLYTFDEQTQTSLDIRPHIYLPTTVCCLFCSRIVIGRSFRSVPSVLIFMIPHLFDNVKWKYPDHFTGVEMNSIYLTHAMRQEINEECLRTDLKIDCIAISQKLIHSWPYFFSPPLLKTFRSKKRVNSSQTKSGCSCWVSGKWRTCHHGMSVCQSRNILGQLKSRLLLHRSTNHICCKLSWKCSKNTNLIIYHSVQKWARWSRWSVKQWQS